MALDVLTIPHLEYLFVAGEIGIAFTGFAGLVTVLASRLAPTGDVNPSVVRLSIVLFSSLRFLLALLLLTASPSYAARSTALAENYFTDQLQPDAHYWTRSKQSWPILDDVIPEYGTRE